MIYIILSVILNCCAAVLIKLGANTMSTFTFQSIITNPFYVSSIVCLGLQAATWQLALKRYALNHAYLFTSLYYPIVLCVSYFAFKEQVTTYNILGTGLIISGIAISQAKVKKA